MKVPNTYFEFAAVTKTGELVWIGQHVQLVCDGDTVTAVHAIARDITRQKEAEDRLRQSEARYRSLIHGAAYGIYRTSTDGRILDANDALANMLGYDSVDELMTRRMTDVYRQASDRDELITRHAGEQHTALDIEWPSGTKQRLTNIAANQFITVEEGKGIISRSSTGK